MTGTAKGLPLLQRGFSARAELLFCFNIILTRIISAYVFLIMHRLQYFCHSVGFKNVCDVVVITCMKVISKLDLMIVSSSHLYLRLSLFSIEHGDLFYQNCSFPVPNLDELHVRQYSVMLET